MNQPSIKIRSATTDEMPCTIATIVAAFIADPPARFAWPSAHDYLLTMPLATREFAGSCFEHGTAYVSEDFTGAALWLPPGVEPDGERLERCFAKRQSPSTSTTCLRHSRRWASRIPVKLIGICRRSASTRTRKAKASERP